MRRPPLLANDEKERFGECYDFDANNELLLTWGEFPLELGEEPLIELGD